MKTKNLMTIVKVILLIAGALVTAYILVQPTAEVRDVSIPVPPLALERIDGGTFSLQSISGRPYLLYVWDFG